MFEFFKDLFSEYWSWWTAFFDRFINMFSRFTYENTVSFLAGVLFWIPLFFAIILCLALIGAWIERKEKQKERDRRDREITGA